MMDTIRPEALSNLPQLPKGEAWKQHPEHPNHLIGSGGSVYNHKTKRLMKRHINDRGYCRHGVGAGLSKKTHRLVLEAYRGPCPDGFEGCHNNGDKSDNSLVNLRWDTRSGNMQDVVRHGTHAWLGQTFTRGEKNGHAVLTEDRVREIRKRVANGETQISLSREFGVSKSQVSQIVKRESWSHVA